MNASPSIAVVPGAAPRSCTIAIGLVLAAGMVALLGCAETEAPAAASPSWEPAATLTPVDIPGARGPVLAARPMEIGEPTIEAAPSSPVIPEADPAPRRTHRKARRRRARRARAAPAARATRRTRASFSAVIRLNAF